jgi:cysteinyl-tRNA synthetase
MMGMLHFHPAHNEFLAVCDALRDVDLFNLGVLLEDRDGGLPSLIKFEDKETLLRQRREKTDQEAE